MNPDFRDMLSEFNAAGVEYLVVGAYALAAHGMPRATGDIDLWVRPSTENARRALAAIARFGAPMHGLSVDDLTTPDTIFQIGVAPRRIDILTSIDGVSFEEAWSNRDSKTIDGLSVFIISKSDFVKNKRASGRPKDLADIAWIEGQD